MPRRIAGVLDDPVAGADIVVIAVPYLAVAEVLPPLADALAGKIVIDPAATTRAVMAFGSEIGFAPLNAGPLKSARYLEAIAHLNLELSFAQGYGTITAIVYDCAPARAAA